MTKAIVKWLDRTFYPSVPAAWDRHLFRQRLLPHLHPHTRLIDIGAGRGKTADLNFRSCCGFTAGVDIDPAVLDNPYLDEAKLIVDGRFAYADNSFDVAMCYDVVEHLSDPHALLAEAARVLRPGGTLLVKTPNRRHYVALAARLLPQSCHRWFHRQHGGKEEDTFATYYQCNTRRALQRCAAACGLTLQNLRLIEDRPGYLRMSWPTYVVGIIYERLVNSWHGFENFRCLILAEFRKEP